MPSIEIPVGNEEVLEIDLEDLEGYDEAILKILVDEKVHLKFYIQFALEYRNKNMLLEFEKFLESGKAVANGADLDFHTLTTLEPHYASQDYYKQLIYNILAAYQIQIARSLGPNEQFSYSNEASTFQPRSKDDLLFNAAACLSLAEQINRLDLTTLTCRADIMLERQQYEQAEYTISGILTQEPHFIPAILAKIVLLERKQDYKAILLLYQKILLIDPEYQPDVRVPLGICFQKLGMIKEARAAYERALSRDSKNVEATIYLSILDVNASKNPKVPEKESARLKKNASAQLMKAFEMNKKQAHVALEMAKKFVDRQQWDKALLLVETCLKNTTMDGLQADALYLKGCIFHAQGLYQEALEALESAFIKDPSSLLIHYGLGQLYIYKGEYEKATFHLEKVLEKEPDNYETIKKLATVYSISLDTRPKALSYFDKLKSLMKSFRSEEVGPQIELVESDYLYDHEVLIELAFLLEEVDVHSSLKYYEQALAVLRDTSQQDSRIPPELLNNIAVLKQIVYDGKKNQHSEALESVQHLYAEALQGIQLARNDQVVDNTVLANQLSVEFNIATLYELIGESAKAEKVYLEMIQKYPAYTDSALRLAKLYFKQRKHQESFDLLKEITEIDKENVSAWLLLGTVYGAMNLMRDSRKTFEHVLSLDNQNPFALVALGNIYIDMLRPKIKPDLLSRAVSFFEKAIRSKSHHLYAAMGLGILLAMEKQYGLAKDVFSQVQEACPLASVTMNLAHIYSDLHSYKQSIILYESILKKNASDKDSIELLSCLAKSYFDMGRKFLDTDALLKAKQLVLRALAESPSVSSLEFNLALVQQTFVQVLNNLPMEKRDLETMKAAAMDIEESESIFQRLAGETPSSKLGFDVAKADYCAKRSKKLKIELQRRIHETETLGRIHKERMADIKEAREAQERQRKEQELRLAEMEAAKEREIEEKRKELIARMQEENERAKSMSDEPLKKKKKREELDEQDQEEHDSFSETKKSKKSKVSVSDMDQEEPIPQVQEDEEEETDMGGKRKFLSKAIVDSSDED